MLIYKMSQKWQQEFCQKKFQNTFHHNKLELTFFNKEKLQIEK